jgi:hypothetical protein
MRFVAVEIEPTSFAKVNHAGFSRWWVLERHYESHWNRPAIDGTHKHHDRASGFEEPQGARERQQVDPYSFGRWLIEGPLIGLTAPKAVSLQTANPGHSSKSRTECKIDAKLD